MQAAGSLRGRLSNVLQAGDLGKRGFLVRDGTGRHT
jgi:hypothetical protein